MDSEFEEIVRRTIDRSVRIGGELMRRQVLALLAQELAYQPEQLADLSAKVRQLPPV